MKKIIIIGILILSTISCKSQIIALENYRNYVDNEIEVADGTYFKDVNHLLDKYIGIWEGTQNNKNYEFRIEKYLTTSNKTNLSYDKLRMRYKITSSNGTIIENTLALPNDSPYIINGDFLVTNTGNYYVLNYIGLNSKCGQNGNIFISVGWNNTNNNMKLSLTVEGEVSLDCTATNIAEQVIPTEQILLIKQ